MCESELETEQNCNILTLSLMAISVSFPLSRAAQPEAWGPTLLGAGFLYRILSPMGLVSKLTDFLSSPSYIIVQSPTQYLSITGHRDVSLLLSLEWHVWLSSSGNNYHAVHKSLSSGASVWLYRGILPCPILSAKPAYANGICNFCVFGMACLAGSRSVYNSLTGFDSEFSFSKTGCLTKAEELSLPYYSWRENKRIHTFLKGIRALFKSWTRLIAFHIALIPLGKVWI